ncbi:Os12g0505100 [Oryza sativa Japonica Group]|uniref:Os12g0505100 protein n=2 Tax=Oryza sativa subsp. japonica TaxID=39947 RepID=Q2QQ67_ORYSJ|nr:hypothetical protein LOC_Os12g32060 [Oryza sativa Japonica Group]EAZ20604.1 hypothetical protein OsJ_36214 [Oryza sativa Japonica Group]KAF2907955.1 hypothetical protein DAI22_12g139200 [Oryza sativa Japonica Group]BAT17284.1 Os12g0505100 [Oryza sativa Japonica Group]
MAAPVLVVVRLNAAAVDPATVVYLRDLVGALNGKTFQLACDSQIAAAAAADNDAGMFRLRPEPSLLAGVPDNVASAINALEKLLRKGSPALAAYERHATFLRRARQEEAVGAALADVVAVNNLINDLQDALDARRVQLVVAQSTKSQIFAEITAAARSPAVITEESRSWAAAELAALLPRLRQAQERETEVEMAMARMMPSFLVMFWHLEIAKARAEAADAALDAIPEMPSNWMDDFQVVRDGAMRFEESVDVLREYMA